MNPLTLAILAEEIEQAWSEAQQIDWSEAEQLVQAVIQLPEDEARKPEIIDILEYAAHNDDWESDVVANWPSMITTALKAA